MGQKHILLVSLVPLLRLCVGYISQLSLKMLFFVRMVSTQAGVGKGGGSRGVTSKAEQWMGLA